MTRAQYDRVRRLLSNLTRQAAIAHVQRNYGIRDSACQAHDTCMLQLRRALGR